MENGFQGKAGQTVPVMSDEFVKQVSDRYIELYEKITGEEFILSDISHVKDRIERNCLDFLEKLK